MLILTKIFLSFVVLLIGSVARIVVDTLFVGGGLWDPIVFLVMGGLLIGIWRYKPKRDL